MIRANRPRDRGHRPVGHDRNGGSQIERNVSEVARVVQEGAQCTSHEFRSLQMKPRRLALHKSHDIAGTQPREPDGSTAETIVKKIADEGHVVDNRCAGQGARFAQVLLVVSRTTLSRAQSRRRYLLDGNHVVTAQKIKKVSKRGHIPQARP